MTFEEAKALLATCERGELRDHAFGDAEVTWTRNGTVVADGYFGADCDEVSSYDLIDDSEEQKAKRWRFEGREARELRSIGRLAAIERNDAAGRRTGAASPETTVGSNEKGKGHD